MTPFNFYVETTNNTLHLHETKRGRCRLKPIKRYYKVVASLKEIFILIFHQGNVS